jgi:hypothetical protein
MVKASFQTPSTGRVTSMRAIPRPCHYLPVAEHTRPRPGSCPRQFGNSWSNPRMRCRRSDRQRTLDVRARRTARARASLQVSLRPSTADFRQASNSPPSRLTLAHCCRRWALQSLRNLRTSANLASVTRHGSETSRMCSLMQVRRLFLPGGIPGHSFWRSALHLPPTTLSCAVASDDHNIKIAPIIKVILTTEGPPTGQRKLLSRKTH